MHAMDDLDRAHHFIMKTFVDTGHAPHYTDIAKEFGVHYIWSW